MKHKLFSGLWFFLLMCICLVSQSAVAALPSILSTFTSPPTGFVDSKFAVVDTPKGYLLAWTRSSVIGDGNEVLAQQFNKAGNAIGKQRRIDGPGVVFDPSMVRVGKDVVALFWMVGENLYARRLTLTGMKLGKKVKLGQSDDHIHAVTRLKNGDIAVITARVDISNPADLRYKNSIRIVTANLKPKTPWRSIHGNGFAMDAFAYLDQAVVSRSGGGGIALFRDHENNRFMVRNFNNSGKAVGTLKKLNTTDQLDLFVVDTAYLRISAARLSNGKIAACWVSLEETGSDRYEVRCRMLSKTGSPLGNDFLVHESTAGKQYSPNVIALPKGRFLVTWVDATLLGGQIEHRLFNANGKPLKPARDSYAYTGFTDLSPDPAFTDAARLGDGSIVLISEQSVFVSGLRVLGIPKPLQ